MKIALLLFLISNSIIAYTKCVEDNAFANNVGIYEWCVGDKVLVEEDLKSKKYIPGVITNVSKTDHEDWIQRTIKITILLSNKKTVVLFGGSTYNKEGCHLYSTPWGSKIRCVGENVKIPIYIGNSNLPSDHFQSGTIVAIGFKFALVKLLDGKIIMHGEFE